MHDGIANKRFPLKSVGGENVPGISGACAARNFTYLFIGPFREVYTAPNVPGRPSEEGAYHRKYKYQNTFYIY